MRTRVGALIIKDNKILLIYRKRNEEEYYVIPGGGVEEGETLEQAFHRELIEETGLTAVMGSHAFNVKRQEELHTFYIANDCKGILQFTDPLLLTNDPSNTYEHQWINISKIVEIPMMGDIKEGLIEYLRRI